MWGLRRRPPGKPKTSRRRASRRGTPSDTRPPRGADRVAIGLRAEARPAIIADVWPPRGTSLADGVSRIECMGVVAMIGPRSAVAGPNLLVSCSRMA